MSNVLSFTARPRSTSSVHALEDHHHHESPALRLYFRTAEGQVARATIHTTLDINPAELGRPILKEIERHCTQALALLGGTSVTMKVVNIIRVEAEQTRSAPVQGWAEPPRTGS